MLCFGSHEYWVNQLKMYQEYFFVITLGFYVLLLFCLQKQWFWELVSQSLLIIYLYLYQNILVNLGNNFTNAGSPLVTVYLIDWHIYDKITRWRLEMIRNLIICIHRCFVYFQVLFVKENVVSSNWNVCLGFRFFQFLNSILVRTDNNYIYTIVQNYYRSFV